MCTRGCQDDYPFRDVAEDAKSLLSRDSRVVTTHRERGESSKADHMAKVSHQMENPFLWFEQPRNFLTGEGSSFLNHSWCMKSYVIIKRAFNIIKF